MSDINTELSGLIDIDEVRKTCDGWKYLSFNCPAFLERVYKFLSEASAHVNGYLFNTLGIQNNNTEVVNLESYTYGSKEVVLSFVTKPKDRENDCQFIQFKKVIFSLNKDNNLVINELSGRCRSDYGYTSLKNAPSGVLNTEYSYNEFTKDGIELVYRSYEDEIHLSGDRFAACKHNLRGCVTGGYNPRIDEYKGGNINVSIQESPKIIEKSRSMKNLGLVNVTTSSFKENGELADKKVNECFNTLIGVKDGANPFLIHVHDGLVPVCEHVGGNLVVNYNLKKDTYKETARSIFCTDINNGRNKLIDIKKDSGKSLIPDIDELIAKYDYLYEMEQLDKWQWKEIPTGKGSTRL